MTRPVILVTGATGTIGSELLKHLASHDVNIRAGFHSNSSNDAVANITFHRVDFTQPDTLREVMHSVDKLFLLTPNAPNAVQMAQNAINIAKVVDVKHIVRLSAYTDPQDAQNPHRVVEDMIIESGLNYTFLRPGPLMQNFANFFGHTIRTQSALYEPLGDAKVSYIDARDIARVAVSTLTEDGHAKQAYHLTGPEALSDYDIARILSDVTENSIQYINISEDEARQSLQNMGMPAPVVEGVLGLYELMREGKRKQTTNHVADITGRPATSFKTFAQDYIEVFSPR
jgi:uncharacterized protein YbjT (DUF2867 family)